MSVNGTINEVADFFRVSIRTVHVWKDARRLPYWQEGRNLVFGEESVLDFWESGYVASRRMEPGETREIGRVQWRACLQRGSTTNEHELTRREAA